jgi:hypothetical protein
MGPTPAGHLKNLKVRTNPQLNSDYVDWHTGRLQELKKERSKTQGKGRRHVYRR